MKQHSNLYIWHSYLYTWSSISQSAKKFGHENAGGSSPNSDPDTYPGYLTRSRPPKSADLESLRIGDNRPFFRGFRVSSCPFVISKRVRRLLRTFAVVQLTLCRPLLFQLTDQCTLGGYSGPSVSRTRPWSRKLARKLVMGRRMSKFSRTRVSKVPFRNIDDFFFLENIVNRIYIYITALVFA